MIAQSMRAGRGLTAAVAAVALMIGFGGNSVKAFAHDHEDASEEHQEEEEAEERHEAHERHEAEEAREAWQQREWLERQQFAQQYTPYNRGYSYGYTQPYAVYPSPGYAPRYYRRAPAVYVPQQQYYGGSSLTFSFGN